MGMVVGDDRSLGVPRLGFLRRVDVTEEQTEGEQAEKRGDPLTGRSDGVAARADGRQRPIHGGE